VVTQPRSALKIAELIPTPKAIVKIATEANPGFRFNARPAYWVSFEIDESIRLLLRSPDPSLK
jgi:hypothetical protein